MTAVDLAVYVGVIGLTIVVILADVNRRARRHAQQRHPANYAPATDHAIEQAVAIVDDGKALVRETEAYLREVAR